MAFNKTYRAASTQTIFDLSVQLKGNADKVFEMIEENPEIDNVNSDATGLEIDYNINNDVVQKYYISKGITVSMKPMDYYNTLEDALLVTTNSYLVQGDGYKILM